MVSGSIQTSPETYPLFRSVDARNRFDAAYQAVLAHWPVPYEERFVPTPFGETHVLACGPQDAPPLVLLHPGGGNALIWIYNVEPLSRGNRVYAIDICGEINRSRPSQPIRTHSEFVLWMKSLLDGLEVSRANLVGNSNGGYYALDTALSLPNRVDRVIVISPAASFDPMLAWWFHLLIPAHILASTFHSERRILRSYDWLWQDFPMTKEEMELRRLSKLVGGRYRPTINTIPPRVFRDDELRQINAPVLLLIGDHEVIYPPERVIRRATRLAPHLSAEIVPNANHSAQYTNPAFVNQRILEFLSRSPAVE